MIQSHTLVKYMFPPSAELEVNFKQGFPQETATAAIFRQIARHPAYNSVELENYGIIGNLLGLVFGEIHSIILGQLRDVEKDRDFVEKWLKVGFDSQKATVGRLEFKSGNKHLWMSLGDEQNQETSAIV